LVSLSEAKNPDASAPKVEIVGAVKIPPLPPMAGGQTVKDALSCARATAVSRRSMGWWRFTTSPGRDLKRFRTQVAR